MSVKKASEFRRLYGISIYAFLSHITNYQARKPVAEHVPACTDLPFDAKDAAILKELLRGINDKPECVELVCMMMDTMRHHGRPKQTNEVKPLLVPGRRSSLGWF